MRASSAAPSILKIGVFDSGIGGATVLASLRKRFPACHFVYFGDTANVPYGTKSEAQIRLLCESAADRIAAHGLDALVVACNTASSLALPKFSARLAPIPVFGMVESGVEAIRIALDALGEEVAETPVAIFGTRATVRSGIYGDRMRAQIPGVTVFEQACPLLVPIIEEGWKDHAILKATLAEYILASKIDRRRKGVALLACTHYPWIRDAFVSALTNWTIIDSAEAVTERIARELKPSTAVSAHPPEIEWFFSDPDAVAPFIFADPALGKSSRGITAF